MKEAKRNRVNRCFGNCPKNFKKGSKSKNLQLTRQQREEREEEVKRILLAAAERKRAKRQKEVLEALLKKATEKKRAKTFKKVMAKEIPEKKRDLVRETAEGTVSGYKKASRDGSLIDLLPMVLRKVRQGDEPIIVLEVLLERIRRNQWDRLSFEDQCRVIQAEASLGKQIN